MAIAGGRERGRPRLRWSASLAVAIGVNLMAVILLAIGGRRTPRFVATPAIELQLLRPESEATDHSLRSARAMSRRPPTRRATRADQAEPVSVPAGAPPTGTLAGRAEPPGGGGGPTDLGKVFRARLGCGDRDGLRLSPEERARCDARLGQGAGQVAAMPAPIDPGKRAWFDATYAAYHPKHPLDGDMPIPIGCKIKFGGPHKKFKPPNSLKIPGLPCYVIPPRGVLTEESGVVRPEHVEAR